MQEGDEENFQAIERISGAIDEIHQQLTVRIRHTPLISLIDEFSVELCSR